MTADTELLQQKTTQVALTENMYYFLVQPNEVGFTGGESLLQ